MESVQKMKTKFLLFFLTLLLTLTVVSSAESNNFGETFEVIIKTNVPQNNFKIQSVDTNEKSSKSNLSFVNITNSEFQELKENKYLLVERIYNIKPFLQESVNITNSTLAGGLTYENLNLTGVHQTICVIDTGVDYTHSDLGGGFGEGYKVVGGYDFGNSDSDPLDNNGHGTHVSGIVSANGSILGIAPDSNLVVIKVFSDAGTSTSDSIPLAIDWCVNNADLYNISVITMSLGLVNSSGSSILNDTFCDSSFPITYSSVQSAIEKNITVLAASGNDGETEYVGMPACLSNVIPVGDTYDFSYGGTLTWGGGTCSDSNFVLDQIVCHANRNSLVQLFAPGAMINSTASGGGYEERGGTSMATPMVAGAVAVIKQYLNLSGQTKTPEEIETILNSTGQAISDAAGSGITFSRINLYDALISIDATSPNVTLISPANNKINQTINQTFICNTTDWQLKNVTFKIWNSTTLYYNETKGISGKSNSTEFNLTNMPAGNYDWTCESYDEKNNLGIASENYSLIINEISVSLSSPANNTFTNTSETNFTCISSNDENYLLSNVTFYLWNSTDLIYNITEDISGTENTTIFNYTFTHETNYLWNCEAVNNISSNYIYEDNYTITYDITNFNITNLTESSVTTSSAIISWNTSEETNATISYGSIETNATFSQNHTFSLTGLSASTTYNYNITSCDRANNCNFSNGTFATLDVTVNNEEVNLGGGGGGGGSSTYTATQQEVNNGYSKRLSHGDKIKFTNQNQEHTLTMTSVRTTYAGITIQSDPVYLNLSIGESAKVNTTSPDYYDLIVKLEDISSLRANITLKSTYEIIPSSNPKLEATGNTQENITGSEETKPSEDSILPNKIFIGLVVLMIIIIVIIANYTLYKKVKDDDEIA